MFEKLRENVRDNIFDYTLLFDVLKDYSKPRDKVTRLINHNDIIQIKRGLYVFGKKWQKGPIHRQILANLIYGPSYISLEYALSLYGMIPERVETVTSMTTKRNNTFKTPFGNFTYFHLNPEQYAVEIDLFSLNQNLHFFIASKEKALSDLVARQQKIPNEKEMWEHLIENLRIEEENLMKLSVKKLRSISEVYINHNVHVLAQCMRRKHD